MWTEVAAAFPTARVSLVDGRDLFWWGIRTPDALERLSRGGRVAAVPSSSCSARSSTPTTSCSATPSAAFIAKELVPHAEEWEHAGIVDREVFAKAGAQGFLGMAVPEEHGGGGVDDFRYNVVIAEEIQQAGVNAAGLGWTLHNDICLPYFLTLCTDEQKARWLPGICSGELITAIAMTEPGIGSDLASMATSAILDGDHYVVNGSKTFITNGINADLVVTAVKTDPTNATRA